MFLSMFALMPVYYGIIMWLCIQIFEYILYVRTLMKILVARHNVLTVEKNTRVPSHFYLVFQLFIIKNVHSFYTCNIRGTTHFYLRFQLFFIKNVPSRYICKTGQLNECMLLLLWRQLLPQMEYMADGPIVWYCGRKFYPRS
jgi:hypothetical protein